MGWTWTWRGQGGGAVHLRALPSLSGGGSCVLPPPPFLSPWRVPPAPTNASHTRTTTATTCVCQGQAADSTENTARPNTRYPSPSTISCDRIPVRFEAYPYYSQCSQLF